ncbi:MAG: hypothetical protein HY302_04620 [Opitutae bacterium]|nr:hypothetical protein [Opitutae bacterium]
MDWILDHIGWLLVAAGAIAQMLMKKKGQTADDDEAAPREETFEDPMLAERTRKIREDIQRKIEERRRGGALTRPEAPPEIAPESVRELPPVVQEVFASPRQLRETADRHETERHAEMLEEQATLADQLRQAQAMKAGALKRAGFETKISDADETNDRSRGALVGELRDPAALRRAFVLREILGPPVALRRQ